MNDTIASISTALGVGAISIIRISGNKAIKIANKIYGPKNLLLVPTHTIHYGHIYDKGNIIDEVLVTIMKGPKTYTTEDVVEINCHGGIATTNKVLELLLENGARLAEPGEFTKRALLNGRIDLIEAEGIMDLINSKTEKSRKLAINQITGDVSNLIKKLKQDLIEVIASIEVNIDYPEYEDIPVMTMQMLKDRILVIKREVAKILKASENSKIIKEGINTLIIGRPNVGKSSILNKLINEEKAIVTNIEGTTRDIVEGTVNLDGIFLNVNDTAGIRETENIIEKIGVERSLNLIDKSDLVILVINNNENITNEDLNLIDKTKNKNRIIFINKSDLEKKFNYDFSKKEKIVIGNVINDNGLDELKKMIREMFNFDKIEKGDFNFLSNARQISILKEVQKIINDIELGIKQKIELDILQIDLIKINKLLGEIIGEEYEEELLDFLFSKFCLGK
jgi:tRNA modification GTPase